MILETKELEASFYNKKVLNGITLGLSEKEIHSLFGPTGCGKSTVLNAIFGISKVEKGRVIYLGKDITHRKPSQNIREGIVLVPQGGRVFRDLTVKENLEMGAFTINDRGESAKRENNVYDFFPILHERRHQKAGSLSGGERQMLALGMALMLSPKVLLLDEPSVGLSPILTKRVLHKVRQIVDHFGASILLVEQSLKQAVEFSDRISIIKSGRTVLTESSEQVLKNKETFKAYIMHGKE